MLADGLFLSRQALFYGARNPRLQMIYNFPFLLQACYDLGIQTHLVKFAAAILLQTEKLGFAANPLLFSSPLKQRPNAFFIAFGVLAPMKMVPSKRQPAPYQVGFCWVP